MWQDDDLRVRISELKDRKKIEAAQGEVGYWANMADQLDFGV